MSMCMYMGDAAPPIMYRAHGAHTLRNTGAALHNLQAISGTDADHRPTQARSRPTAQTTRHPPTARMCPD